jgi:hypothetical protein
MSTTYKIRVCLIVITAAGKKLFPMGPLKNSEEATPCSKKIYLIHRN